MGEGVIINGGGGGGEGEGLEVSIKDNKRDNKTYRKISLALSKIRKFIIFFVALVGFGASLKNPHDFDEHIPVQI